jgi:acylphosphatase
MGVTHRDQKRWVACLGAVHVTVAVLGSSQDLENRSARYYTEYSSEAVPRTDATQHWSLEYLATPGGLVAEGKQRKEVLYSGHVQGVGFRYTTRHIGSRFDVSGFVRNLPNGQVHLVVEGRPAEVRQFLTEVASAFAGSVTKAEVEDGECTGEFTGFEIRF